MIILSLKSANVYYRDRKILTDISLDLEAGKLYILKGGNGAGKTTLLNAIAGLENYSIEGNLYFEGDDKTKLPLEERVKRGIILVPQHLPKDTEVKLSDFISALKKKYNILNKEFFERFSNRILFKDFSGGESKLIDFYLALSLKPKLLLIDELDSGLDENNTKLVAKELNAFLERGGTILLVTHHKKILEHLPEPFKVYRLEKGTLTSQ